VGVAACWVRRRRSDLVLGFSRCESLCGEWRITSAWSRRHIAFGEA
jgi:hypothetical protein